MADDQFQGSSGGPFTQVPVEVTVSVGKARPKVKDLLRMGPGGILSLDKRVDDPVELYVGDKLIARGELVEAEGGAEGQLAVRLTEVPSPEERS